MGVGRCRALHSGLAVGCMGSSDRPRLRVRVAQGWRLRGCVSALQGQQRAAKGERMKYVIEVESGMRWSIVCHCGSKAEAEQRAAYFRPMACFSGREIRIRTLQN